jgi:SAM-dependent methyltransferase
VLRRIASALEFRTQTQVMHHPRRDMVTDDDEEYYGAQYVHWLDPLIDQLPHHARVLDWGCGYGRLALHIAGRRSDCAVTGIDLAAPAIAGARAHAAARGLTNCAFQQADLNAALPTLPGGGAADLILFVEVAFYAPRELHAVEHAARVLKPGGLFYGAFRSQWLNLSIAAAMQDFESARTIRDSREGRLWNRGDRFAWSTPDDISKAYDRAGIPLIEPCHGIGVLSSLSIEATGRPRPAAVADRDSLRELELSLANQYAAQGRYIVGVGRRPSA